MGRAWQQTSARKVAGADLAGLHGNAYIKAARSGFAKELSDPQKRLAFAGMLLSEGNPLQTAELAMNRSSFQHKSLAQALHSGFYGRSIAGSCWIYGEAPAQSKTDGKDECRHQWRACWIRYDQGLDRSGHGE